ncbi:PREDICTED: gastrokine-2, partial [Tinamus guttatus]|uniref:gastrokine-2 n=1 Tax=Tinamus guttatus TaxID=94827 RepID=UPI00052EC241
MKNICQVSSTPTAAILALLGVFLTPTSSQTYDLSPENGLVTATMTIDNKRNLADVHIRSGLYSSDTIFDYQHGYIAARVFSRNACFILKMGKNTFPELREIGRRAYEKE